MITDQTTTAAIGPAPQTDCQVEAALRPAASTDCSEPDSLAPAAAPELGPPRAPASPMAGEPDRTPPRMAAAPAAGAAGPAAAEPAAAAAQRGAWGAATRYGLIVACAACSAGLGALGGSTGLTRLEHFLWAPAPARADSIDELRPLKDGLAQLRTNVKSMSDNLSALRANFTAASAAANAQLSKIAEQVDKVERAQSERHAAAPAEPPAASDSKNPLSAKPPVIEGWVLRRVFDGAAALVESRHGVIEVEPGDSLPGLGRIEEIKRQDGRWVVVTARGVILPTR